MDSQRLTGLNASSVLTARERAHLDRCLACRRAAREHGISDAAFVRQPLRTTDRARRVVIAGSVALVVGAVAVATPLRGAALTLLSAFEPQRVAAVPMTLDDLQHFGATTDLSAYASTRELRASSSASFSDVRSAALAAGFALRVPTAVPSGIHSASFLVNGPSSQIVTFASNSHAASAAGLPALPADIAKTTLQINLGATVVATYETVASAADRARLFTAIRRMQGQHQNANRAAQAERVRPLPATTISRVTTGSTLSSAPRAPQGRIAAPRAYMISTGGGFEPLVVVQMRAPQIIANGASVQRIISFMLAQPGIPPRIAAAFGALGDLSTTLPIPVPIDKAFTQPVLVDGVTGVGLGDNTGLGAAVIWQKDGMIYAVFATQPAPQVLAIADSLR